VKVASIEDHAKETPSVAAVGLSIPSAEEC
jgi:hypothetical protein